MKVWVAVLASAALAFVLTFTLVPRRPATQVPPSWFELPGTPVSVDGEPVRDWEQANEKLRRAVDTWYGQYSREHSYKDMPPEIEARPIRVTYVRHWWSADSDSSATETVVVRPFLPITINYTRGPQEMLARFELERSDSMQ